MFKKYNKEIQRREDIIAAQLRKISMLRQTIKNTNHNIDSNKAEIDLIEWIFRRKFIIEGVKINKKHEKLYICSYPCDPFSFYLIGINYTGNQSPCLLSDTMLMDCSNGKIIYIADILAVNRSRGNGSILMEHFLNKAKVSEYKKIKGSLSSVDKDHFDILENYYKKFGFEVKFNDDRSSGRIEKTL